MEELRKLIGQYDPYYQMATTRKRGVGDRDRQSHPCPREATAGRGPRGRDRRPGGAVPRFDFVPRWGACPRLTPTDGWRGGTVLPPASHHLKEPS